jgi:hypothetical protein
LPPVSMTPAANFAPSSTGVVVNGGKFATGVNDGRGKLPLLSTTLGENLPPVRVWDQYQSADNLKGQCHEIFYFWFFSGISFPQAPQYTIRAVSNFIENSLRYSQLKVCHQCR